MINPHGMLSTSGESPSTSLVELATQSYIVCTVLLVLCGQAYLEADRKAGDVSRRLFICLQDQRQKVHNAEQIHNSICSFD